MNIINVPKGTQILFVGDIHEHDDQFFSLMENWKPSLERWVVSLGDVCDKGKGDGAFEKVSHFLQDGHRQGWARAIKGNHELKRLKNRRHNLKDYDLWWKERQISLSFQFYNSNIITCVHAGIPPKLSSDDLKKNLDVCYVRDVDDQGIIPLIWKHDEINPKLVKAREGGISWHEIYDGRFGYVISGHNAQTDGIPKFFNYSCNIDTGVYETGILTGQIIDENGKLGETLQIKGEVFRSK
jgi:hypothetical protein